MNAHYVHAELTRRRSRVVVGVLTVAVGVALFLSLQAYSAGYQKAARVPLTEIGADSSYAADKRLEIGSQMTMAGRPFKIVGLVDTSRAGQVANANLYFPLAEAQAMATASPQVRAVHDFRANDANILFLRADPAQGPAIAEQVKRLLEDQAIVTTPRSFDRVLGSTFTLIDRFGLTVGLAGLLVTMLGLLRTTAAGLWERRRDVGLLRALGWRRRDVVEQLLAETFVLTALGGLAGLLMAAGVAWGLGFSRVTVPVPWELSPTPMFVPGGPAKMAVTVPMDAGISPAMALAALAIALIGGELVSLGLARRAAGVRPAEVMRNE